MAAVQRQRPAVQRNHVEKMVVIWDVDRVDKRWKSCG